MVTATFVLLARIAPDARAPSTNENVADTLATGDREVTYTISNIGESYVKDSSASALGRHGSTPGLSEWWTVRKMMYGDTIVHNAFPYSVAGNRESAYNRYYRVNHIPFEQFGFYRFAFEARNLTTVATGPNKDPLYLPTLGGLALDGGTVHLNWHITYLTSTDVTSMLAGTHYANTYYGVTSASLAPLRNPSYANDGWYIEHSGTMDFDVPAAKKFLNIAGADLRTAFTAANVGGALNISFWNHYWTEGSPNAIYDIFSCYDYSINAGPMNTYFLKLDPSSTATNLVLRLWGYTWGFEALMTRYLDVQGLMHNFIPWPEDWYFNATITSTGANVDSRMEAVYHMTTWKDTNWWGPSYMLEAQHNDYNDQRFGWVSRFYDYAAYALAYSPTRQQWEPGTNNIGSECAYIVTPTLWNLGSYEKLIVKLPTGPYIGYVPYKGTVSDVFPRQGGGNDAKVAEMNTHQMWGELVLGPGTLPSALYSNTYYNATSKILTINGPTSWTGNMNPHAGYSTLYETGVPKLMFDVAKVSNYQMDVVGGMPTGPGIYTLRVTAKNITGNTVTDWNGTVDLTSSNAILAVRSHWFVPSDQGVWWTTFQPVDYGDFSIMATDRTFPLDVSGVIGTMTPPPPNTPPTAVFTVTPPTGDTNDVYSFDASSCSDAEDPTQVLEVRWDWTSDGVFDTGWGAYKIATHQYAMPGEYTVTLEVRDTGGLTAAASHSVVVYPPVPPPNTPPTAEFAVTPLTGDTNAVYSFDASSCSDKEDLLQALVVRWDWTSDGVFDTEWGEGKIATHQYAMPGKYTVTLEVRDTGGLTASVSHSIVVYPPVPPPVTILKSSKAASNPVVWYYQPMVSGAYSLKIDNTGFKSMVIEVYDVTGGSSTKLFRQTIKFSSYAAYPAGTAISDQCALIAGHNYKIVVKDYAGPVGSKAVVYSMLSWSP